MKELKAISFDLWGTLIKSNPNYRDARAEYLRNHCKFDAFEINNIISEIKKDIDENVEKFGLHYESGEVYKLIGNALKLNVHSYNVQQHCNKLFITNHPVLIDSKIPEMLKEIKDAGIKIYLSSNTVLIDGNILREALKQLDIFQYFDSFLFSNELEVSKPNPLFFQRLHMTAGCLKSKIVHIGDNDITDVEGASKYGINNLKVYSNKNVVDVFNQLKELYGKKVLR